MGKLQTGGEAGGVSVTDCSLLESTHAGRGGVRGRGGDGGGAGSKSDP